MQSDIDLLGAFVPGIAVWFVLSVAIFIPLDAVLTRRGAYRCCWHASLVRLALFVSLFCTGELLTTLQ